MLHRLRLTKEHDLLSIQTRFRQSVTVIGTHLAFEYWVGQTHYGPPGPPYGAPMVDLKVRLCLVVELVPILTKYPEQRRLPPENFASLR